MDYKFRPQLTRQILSYANNTPHASADTLDCSLGVNPYGCPGVCADALRAFDPSRLTSYPHTHVLHEAIAGFWRGIAPVEADDVILADGSDSGLDHVNNIFAQTPRNEVVGFVPTFTDMIESVRDFAMTYIGVSLRMNENGAVCAEDLIPHITDKTAFVYLDRANNPTGQTMPLDDVKTAAKAAAKTGAYIVIDEAYGGFLPRAESAMTLRGELDNLIVIRTFSKGFGLANLRCGYVVADKAVSSCLNMTLNPYVISELTREICAAALTEPEHPASNASNFASAKAAIREAGGDRITMLKTDDRVPICTLELHGEGDLQELLLKQGILTVSGREFEHLGPRYVRLRVSTADNTDRIVKAVRNIAAASRQN